MDGMEPARPADPEIARLETELASLGQELSGVEAALVSSRARLGAFALVRDRLLLPLQAELTDIEAQNAEILAADTGRPDDLRDARKARTRADASAEAARAAVRRPGGPPQVAPPQHAEARRLYRALVDRCHPDLGRGAADRRQREPFMQRANDAYVRGDTGALRALAQQWDASEPAVTAGDEPAAALRAAVQAGQDRLAQARAQLAEVTGGTLGRLLFEWARDAGEDPQAPLRLEAGRLRARIAGQQRLLEDIKRQRR
jgi:hypothetical protein